MSGTEAGLPVQGFHFPFPGHVTIEVAGEAYRAAPID
jgi:hypothetical protein